MLAEGEYNPSQGTCSKNDEKDQNHHVPPSQEMAPAVFSPRAEKRAKITAVDVRQIIKWILRKEDMKTHVSYVSLGLQQFGSCPGAGG